jgi:antibiotic biosynthesis monooxygenase
MSLTLVNFFTVPETEAENFLARFKGVAERLQDLPGFEGTDLHRYAGVGDPTYAFVNIAKWESAEAWQAAFPKIMAGGGGLGSGVIPKAALYESVFQLQGAERPKPR